MQIMLPPEILQKIFKNLNFTDLKRAILVSKGWKSVAEDPQFWKKIQIVVAPKDFEIVVKIPRLSLIENMVLRTRDKIKTQITFNFE